MSDSRPHPEPCGAGDPDADGRISAAGAARLGAALGGLYGGDPEVPPAVDAAVRKEIRRSFGRERPRRSRWRIGAPIAAAAGLVLAVGVWRVAVMWRPAPESHSPPSTPAVATARGGGDFDLSGKVDILDAFDLARRLDHGPVDDDAFDLNRDGVVDGRDVDAVAMRAVTLNGGAG